MDVNQLTQAKANVTLCQQLLTQAIEKSASDSAMAEQALKQAIEEIASAQTAASQVQSALIAQKSQQAQSE